MQTLKSFTFIVLLCGSFSVFSSSGECRTGAGAGAGAGAGTDIANSTFTSGGTGGTCSCKDGYELSEGGGNWGSVVKQGNFDSGTCTLSDSNANGWAIGGGIAAGVAVGGAGAVYYVKTKFGGTARMDAWQEWNGTEEDYLTSYRVVNRELEGSEQLRNLSAVKPGNRVNLQLDALNDEAFESNGLYKIPLSGGKGVGEAVFVKYDNNALSEVLVDSKDRLLARWYEHSTDWEPVEGAERWRYSSKFQYRVISTSKYNFLNPRTGEFELENPVSPWEASTTEEYLSALGGDVQLQGVGARTQGLSNLMLRDKDFDLQKAWAENNYNPLKYGKNFYIKYDTLESKNVMVDKDERLIAEWEKSDGEWVTTEGAEQWKYNDFFGHKVISTSDSNFLNPNTGQFEPVSEPWTGTSTEYLAHENIIAHNLEGVEFVPNLGTNSDTVNFVEKFRKAIKYGASDRSTVKMRFDPATGDQVLADKDQRLLARWKPNDDDDPSAGGEWEPAEGSERWVYNERLGYRVIAKNKEGTNFLNPNTETYEKTGTRWIEDPDGAAGFDAGNAADLANRTKYNMSARGARFNDIATEYEMDVSASTTSGAIEVKLGVNYGAKPALRSLRQQQKDLERAEANRANEERYRQTNRSVDEGDVQAEAQADADEIRNLGRVPEAPSTPYASATESNSLTLSRFNLQSFSNRGFEPDVDVDVDVDIEKVCE